MKSLATLIVHSVAEMDTKLSMVVCVLCVVAQDATPSNHQRRRKMMCSGNCHQGRKQCPTPEACELPEQNGQSDMVGSLLIAMALVCALAVIVVVLR